MRTILSALLSLALFGTLTVTGCGDDSTSGNQDLSVNVVPGTCNAIINCAAGCAGVYACIQTCVGKGSATAQTKFNALLGCAVGDCQGAGDAGSPKCTSTTDTSMACIACATVATQSATCSTQLAACAADK